MAFRSLSICAYLCALGALVLGRSYASENDNSWSVLERFQAVPDLRDFFASVGSRYNATGEEPNFFIPESRLLQVSRTKSKAATDDGAATDDEVDTTTSSAHFGHGETDDGSYLNKTAILPPERDQPRVWPAIVLILFLVMAVILLGMTVYKNCRKRSQYQDVPAHNLIV